MKLKRTPRLIKWTKLFEKGTKVKNKKTEKKIVEKEEQKYYNSNILLSIRKIYNLVQFFNSMEDKIMVAEGGMSRYAILIVGKGSWRQVYCDSLGEVISQLSDISTRFSNLNIQNGPSSDDNRYFVSNFKPMREDEFDRVLENYRKKEQNLFLKY